MTIILHGNIIKARNSIFIVIIAVSNDFNNNNK